MIAWLRQFSPLFLVVACVKLTLYSLCLAVIGTLVWDVITENELAATAGAWNLFWALGGAVLANIAIMMAWRLTGQQVFRSKYGKPNHGLEKSA